MKPDDSKKPYAPPVLTRYGSIEQLTQGTTFGGNTDSVSKFG